jgi:hypothetical protein
MKTLKLICIIAVLLDFVCDLMFSIKPNTGAQLLGMLIVLILIFLLLVSFIAGICFVRRDKFRAFIPAAICLVGLPANLFIASYLGVSIRDWQFQKNLPRYSEVVHLVEKGEIKTGSSLSKVELPQQYSNLALIALGKTNSESGATIEFIIGGGFPVKHSGYLYISSGKIENDPEMLERWPYRSQIKTNWFRISD